MTSSAKFSSLILEDNSNGGKHFRLIEDLTWQSDRFGLIVVPRGFCTDLASIPRGLWNLLPPFGAYDRAGVVHDWMYFEGPRSGWTRKDADQALKEGMEDLGVRQLTVWAIYGGVRLGGSQAWKKHRREDPHGDAR